MVPTVQSNAVASSRRGVPRVRAAIMADLSTSVRSFRFSLGVLAFPDISIPKARKSAGIGGSCGGVEEKGGGWRTATIFQRVEWVGQVCAYFWTIIFYYISTSARLDLALFS